MQISISNAIGRAISLGSYASKLIKAFKARVLSYPTSIFEAEACLDATLTELNAIGLLKEASLVITPNAYNEGILYDVVPNTTLGDMDVVRATTATRVNSEGLIEVVPRNLLTYSEQFNDPSWVNNGATIIPNVTIAPDGNLTADRLTATGAGRGVVKFSTWTATNNVASCFVKANPSNLFRIANVSAGGGFVTFNLSTQAIIATTGFTGTIEALPNGWFRCIAIDTLARSGTFSIGVPAIGESVFVWGAQLDQGSLTEYFPTTTRLNIPRIDYTNGSCPSLLVEGQRTNVATYSEQFDNAAWTKQASIITANSINSPAGSLNADTINEGTTNSVHRIISSGAATSNGTYTASVFIKKGTRRYAILGVVQALNEIFVVVDTDNFTITQTGANGTYTYVSNSIVQYSDGWFKLSLTGNILIGSVTTLALSDVGNPSSSVKTYTGNSSYIYAWGAQLEAGSYPTSYIPTVASSVTRNADVISKTGISSLIGQTEGTMFVDLNFNNSISKNNVNRIVELTNSINSDRIIIAFSGVASLITRVTVLGVEQASFTEAGIAVGKLKVALSYSSNGCKFYVNGVLRQSNLSAIIPITNTINLGFSGAANGNHLNDSINSSQLYKTALTDQECINLTTL